MHRGAAVRPWIAAALVALAVGFCAPAAADDPAGTFRYTVKGGDSCGSIAVAFYGEKRYDLMHRHNDLGPTPHNLKADQVLILPRAERQALVGHKFGPVRAAGPGRAWDNAYAGLDLYRRWRVNSLEHGFAEVVFKDDSSLALRENTLLVIYGGTRSRTRTERMRAELERGALRTRLGELAGEEVPASGIEVATAGSSALLGSGSALVSVDEAGDTRVANHGGAPARVRSRNGGRRAPEVVVSAGFGSKVETGSAPTPPKQLPPTPNWTTSAPSRFHAIQTSGSVYAQWTAVKEAASYRVELSRDADGRNLVMAAEVPADRQGLALRRVPVGIWYLSVIAVDDDQFESRPSARLSAEVIAVVIEDPVDGAALTMPGTVWPGSRVRVRAGGACQTEQLAAAQTLTLVRPGDHRVTCTPTGGAALAPFTLAVRPGNLSIDLAGEGMLRRGTRNLIRLDGAAPLLAHVTLQSKDAAIWPPEIDGDDLLVPLLPHRDAPDVIEITAHVDGAQEPVGAWTLTMAPVAEVTQEPADLPDVWAGVRAGRFVRSPRLSIDAGTLDAFVAPSVGVRWNATQRFILQAQMSGGVVGIGPEDQGPIATQFSWSVGVGWLGSRRPMRPLFEVGAGQYTLVGHEAARLNAFQGSARAGVIVGPGPGLRLTINQDFLASRAAGFATATGVTAGVSFEY